MEKWNRGCSETKPGAWDWRELLGPRDGVLTLADLAHTPGDPHVAGLDPYRPSSEIARLAQPGKPLQQWKWLASLIECGLSMRTEAHTDIGLCGNHRSNTGRMAVARIGQHQFSSLKAKAPEAFGGTGAARRSQIEVIALQPNSSVVTSELRVLLDSQLNPRSAHRRRSLHTDCW